MQELLGHYDFYDQLRNRQFELNEQIKKRKESLKKTQNGILGVRNRGNYIEYYIREKGEKTGHYIKKSNAKLVRSLAQKSMMQYLLKKPKKN